MNKSKNFSGQPIISQVLKLLPSRIITRTAEKHQSDRYYKRFKTYDHLVTMIFATLSGSSSLREVSSIMLDVNNNKNISVNELNQILALKINRESILKLSLQTRYRKLISYL